MANNDAPDPKAGLLDIARELKEHPDRWCQGEAAMDDEGRVRDFSDPKAVKWCLLGHVWKRAGLYSIAPIRKLLTSVLRDLPAQVESVGWGPVRFNDEPGRTVQDIINLCEEAAGASEKEKV